MDTLSIKGQTIDRKALEHNLQQWLSSHTGPLNNVLLLPPDITRFHSAAGEIVRILYEALGRSCRVDIMPALGTHVPMSAEERIKMFGSQIPAERYIAHDWRRDIVKIGEIPADFVSDISNGLVQFPIDVEVNKRLLDETYDLIISIGQVVPHEVVGMANYTKNILVGCGGKDMINKSHFLGAAYGMEKLMGRDHSPVRRLFDYAEEHFLSSVPLQYIFTVTTADGGKTNIHGLFAGRERALFEAAVELSQKCNLDLLSAPLKKVVVYLDPEEFKSTWLGNKAVYRTRMAIADGGELIVIAPGLKQFGEDPIIDGLIRRHGYVGSKRVLDLVESDESLSHNLSAAAHLIHGSSEGRFGITYAPGHLTREEIEGVNFRFMPLSDALDKYHLDNLKDGHNVLPDGEEIFYISNPALGLWALKDNF